MIRSHRLLDGPKGAEPSGPYQHTQTAALLTMR